MKEAAGEPVSGLYVSYIAVRAWLRPSLAPAVSIVFIMVPLVTPIIPILGFDLLWFAMMIVVNLQMSFMTPPMAPAMFFLRGITKPEWGIEMGHIIRGVIPFVASIMVGLGVCIAFPDIIMWLPHLMIKF